ncbi:MAG: hypothetical protein ACRCZI_05300, partial [Cetobacterium sp.]
IDLYDAPIGKELVWASGNTNGATDVEGVSLDFSTGRVFDTVGIRSNKSIVSVVKVSRNDGSWQFFEGKVGTEIRASFDNIDIGIKADGSLFIVKKAEIKVGETFKIEVRSPFNYKSGGIHTKHPNVWLGQLKIRIKAPIEETKGTLKLDLDGRVYKYLKSSGKVLAGGEFIGSNLAVEGVVSSNLTRIGTLGLASYIDSGFSAVNLNGYSEVVGRKILSEKQNAGKKYAIISDISGNSEALAIPMDLKNGTGVNFREGYSMKFDKFNQTEGPFKETVEAKFMDSVTNRAGIVKVEVNVDSTKVGAGTGELDLKNSSEKVLHTWKVGNYDSTISGETLTIKNPTGTLPLTTNPKNPSSIIANKVMIDIDGKAVNVVSVGNNVHRAIDKDGTFEIGIYNGDLGIRKLKNMNDSIGKNIVVKYYYSDSNNGVLIPLGEYDIKVKNTLEPDFELISGSDILDFGRFVTGDEKIAESVIKFKNNAKAKIKLDVNTTGKMYKVDSVESANTTVDISDLSVFGLIQTDPKENTFRIRGKAKSTKDTEIGNYRGIV